MSLLASVKRALKNPTKGEFYPEDQARDYARWLAARDGVALPDDRWPVIDWAKVGKSRRARAVTFRDRNGAVTINIPNWDWRETVNEMHD
jgi:hypothetical protein